MHTSTSFHLNTETTILSTLYNRSKAQHRSQLFLRNLYQVIRLGRAVGRSLEATLVQNEGSTAGSKKLEALVLKFIPALVLAGAATRKMLQLHHFVPLQTLLMASYARLLAVSLHIASDIGLEVNHSTLVSGVARKAEEVEKVENAIHVPETDGPIGDVGEKIEREAVSTTLPSTEIPSTLQPGQRKLKGKEPIRTSIEQVSPPTADVPVSSKKKAEEDVSPDDQNILHTSNLKIARNDERDKSKEDKISVTKKKEKSDSLDAMFSAPKSNKHDDPIKPLKKKKRDELDDIFGATEKKKKKKTKKKEVMDDIFGF